MPINIEYMKKALELAEIAGSNADVPVGCVIVCENKIIGQGYNRRELFKDVTEHAEINAIRQACKHLGRWQLNDCDLYVTLEPCPMCAGAIINSRIRTVIYGADNTQTGSCGSVLSLFQENFPHKPIVYGGVLQSQSLELLQMFFKNLR